MNDRINKVVPGTGIRASWGNDVIDQLRRLKIIPGNGIKVSTSAKGTVISLEAGGDTGGNNAEGVVSDVIPCITAQSNQDAAQGYQVYLYANGLGEAQTGTGRLYLPEVSPSTQLPSGVSVLAHVCEANFTQSDEEGDDIAPEQQGG